MTPDLQSYQHIIVAFSGGKDSLACVLHLMDCGVPAERIELWHHDVDGREGSKLMDWPVTRSYCERVAKRLGCPIYFSWKVGGFEREMQREGTATAPIRFETPEGLMKAGGEGPPGTRLKFPQVSADLSVRWCSAYLKIDVGSTALRNQPRFENARTLFVTGERAEESSARAKYKEFEPHRADLRNGKKKRHVDQWRPIHAWKEAQVWEVIQRHGITPHPAYMLGWGRVSCASCIFGSPDQWASLRAVSPEQFEAVAGYEAKFGVTIQRTRSVRQLADAGRVYEAAKDAEVQKLALDAHFAHPVKVDPKDWKMPAGAFGESCGPT